MEVIVNDQKVNYEVQGEGQEIVLLPGWLCSLEALAPIANFLKYTHKVYSIDVLGFGRSDKLTKPMNTNDYGDFLQELLRQLNIKNPILLGHSHGGRMIINYAGRRLGDVEKIILIDAAGLKPKRKLSYYWKVYRYKFFKNVLRLCPETEMFENMKKRYTKKAGSADYQNSDENLKKTMITILNEDETKLLKNIDAWGPFQVFLIQEIASHLSVLTTHSLTSCDTQTCKDRQGGTRQRQ